MSHTRKRIVRILICGTLLMGISACTSNIKHIPATATTAPKEKTYSASYDKVWNAAMRALSEETTFKILDKSSGVMVTEFTTIDGKELSLIQTCFLGKTYKSSYTVNIKQGGGKTDVRVNVKLQAAQAVLLLAREESNADVESYLRQKLFDGISSNLR